MDSQDSDDSNFKSNKFRYFISSFIKSKESQTGSIININDVAQNTGHEKRRLYELFSVLCSFNICSRNGNQCYLWNSLKEIEKTLFQLYYEIEKKSINSSILSLFEIEDSPSISSLALKFVSLLMYFSGTAFNFREISALMSSNSKQFKSIFRRLYPTACFLEGLGIIEHLSDKSCYKLSYSYCKIPCNVIMKLSILGNECCTNLMNLINRKDITFINDIFLRRRSLIYQLLIIKHPHLKPTEIEMFFQPFPEIFV